MDLESHQDQKKYLNEFKTSNAKIHPILLNLNKGIVSSVQQYIER